MKVLITPRGFAKYGLDEVQKMKDAGIEVQYNDTGMAYTQEEFLKYAKDVDGIIVGVDKMDAKMMSSCPNLKVICKFGVGTDNIDLDYSKENMIRVGRAVGANSLSVAEHVLAMVYADAKNLYQSIEEVKNGKWNKITGSEVSGKTLGIIGFGMIGKHLACIAKGVGMNVMVNDVAQIDEQVVKEYGVTVVDKETIFKNCDYISLHIPLLKETKNSISSNEFAMMKPTACLLNGARGGVVDEEALLIALQSGTIRSACFDVFSTEPPEKNEDLLELHNFTLTPHIASRTMEAEIRTCKITTEFIMKNLGKDIA